MVQKPSRQSSALSRFSPTISMGLGRALITESDVCPEDDKAISRTGL